MCPVIDIGGADYVKPLESFLKQTITRVRPGPDLDDVYSDMSIKNVDLKWLLESSRGIRVEDLTKP